MHWIITNIIVMTNKVKGFIGKLDLQVRKLEGKSLAIFSRWKDFVEENNVETSDTRTDQWIKDQLVNVQSRFSKYLPQSRFSKYFPEAVSDKHKWITNQFHADSLQNYEFSLEKKEAKYIDITSVTSLEVQFPSKSFREFWVGIGGELPHFSREALTSSFLSQHPTCATLDFQQ
jgi:hypothetical protein